MNSRTFLLSLGLVAISGLGFLGCGNPADNVTEAQVGEASQKGATPSSAGGKAYAISSDSTIGFVGSKVTGSHEGGFESFTGSITVADGKIVAPSQVEIDMNSTWSDNNRLTGHLKNADFFEVEQYPTSTFEFTGTEPGADGKTTVQGNLTLHGVTKSISFPADVQITEDAISLTAEFFIQRYDFGIAYKGRADDLIRDEVVIKLDVKAAPEA